MKKLLRLFMSVRLAVALILVIAALSLAGVFLQQIPQNFAASPDGYAWWVENVASRELGGVAEPLAALGFFHIFRSAWFIAAAGLLMLNIVVCTAARIRPLRQGTRAAAVRQDDGFYADADSVSPEPSPGLAAVADQAGQALRAGRYTVRREEDEAIIWLAADKHRLSSWGTLLVHLSLILLLAGVLVGTLFGFRNETFTVAEGTAADVGYGTGLSLRLNAFSDTYWEDGTPLDYQSDVTVFRNGAIVRSGVIRVNHPLKVNGVRFHQGYFGPAAGLVIQDENGDVLFSGSIALTGIQTGGSLSRPKGVAVLADGKTSMILLGSAGSADPSIGADQVGLELYDGNLIFIGWLLLLENTPAQLNGMTFTYHALQYAGFMVSAEPGAPFLWAAAALFLLGIATLFYFPHRRLWIRLQRMPDGKISVTLKPAGMNGADRILEVLKTPRKPGGNERES
jgi:cytochrome c biogenesis protein